MIGPVEIIALLFIIFLIFGAKRITNLTKSLGKGATDFIDELGSPKTKEEDPEEEREPRRELKARPEDDDPGDGNSVRKPD